MSRTDGEVDDDVRPRLWRQSTLVTMLCVAAVLAGCRDGVEPPQSELVPLFDLAVPETATPLDTVRVAYSYLAVCGPTPTVEVDITANSASIAVWREVPRYPWPCAAIMPPPTRAEFVITPRGAGTEFVVRFRQPTGSDSVRSVRFVATPESSP